MSRKKKESELERRTRLARKYLNKRKNVIGSFMKLNAGNVLFNNALFNHTIGNDKDNYDDFIDASQEFTAPSPNANFNLDSYIGNVNFSSDGAVDSVGAVDGGAMGEDIEETKEPSLNKKIRVWIEDNLTPFNYTDKDNNVIRVVDLTPFIDIPGVTIVVKEDELVLDIADKYIRNNTSLSLDKWIKNYIQYFDFLDYDGELLDAQE